MIASAPVRPSPWPVERFAIGAFMLAAIVGMQLIAWLTV
jgi:hypothetical protein